MREGIAARGKIFGQNSFSWKQSINTLFKDRSWRTPLSSQVFTFPSPCPASGPSYHPRRQPLQVSLSLASCELRKPRWGRHSLFPSAALLGWGGLTGEQVSGKCPQEALSRGITEPMLTPDPGQGQRSQLHVQDRDCPLRPTAHKHAHHLSLVIKYSSQE